VWSGDIGSVEWGYRECGSGDIGSVGICDCDAP
jgi:hypothetical protein